MDISDEAAKRGVLLTFLYENRKEKYADVGAARFSPTWSIQDIRHYGHEFYTAGLIEKEPLSGEGGLFMRISNHGKAVWEKREVSSLDIDGLPND